MKLLIIGNAFGHDAQYLEDAQDKPEMAALKGEFRFLLQNKIADRSVQFIGEEAKYGVQTIAQDLGIRRENIDMPMEERKARGLDKEQANRPWAPMYLGPDAKNQLTKTGHQKDAGNGWVHTSYRVPSDAEREKYMFDRVLAELKGADSVLIICGILHSLQIADLFSRNSSNTVEVEFWGYSS
jgi:hypothetical protein